MKYSTALILMACLTGCSDTAQKLQLPKLEGDPAAIQLITSNWGKLLTHCPGLSKYHNDMVFLNIEDMLSPDMEDMARVDVVFKITDKPKTIPDEFRAWGHTCQYSISPDGNSIRILKDVCVSVCLKSKNTSMNGYVAAFK